MIWAGDVYTYTIPTFTVVSVKLRHIEVSAREGPKFYAFMKDDIDEPLLVPRTVIILEACYVDVSIH